MNKKNLSRMIFASALLLFAACSQDDLMSDNGTTLPEGEYPLEIASVTMDVTHSEQPWSADVPQTRVSEKADGNSSIWQTGDKFHVKFKGSDAVGTYRITGSSAVEAVESVYWQSASEEQTIIAWYAPEREGAIDISNQTDGLAYVMRAEQQATYNSSNPVSLSFTHQLAKVRVYLRGTGYEGNATAVKINNCTTAYSINQGEPKATSFTGSITMHPATVNGQPCFEANILPGTLGKKAAFTVKLSNNKSYDISLNNDLAAEAAQLHTVTLRLHKQGTTTVDLSAQTDVYTISGDGTYYFTGSGSHGISVTGGSPHIWLDDASININNDNHAINVESGNPTIYILGNNNISVGRGNYGAGIYVAPDKSVTITGTDVNDVLEVTGGSGSSGIGGYTSSDYKSHSCGNITIKNVTIRATSNYPKIIGGYAAAIGATGDKTVGSIKIDKSVVYVRAGGDRTYGGAGIGGGLSSLSNSGQTEFDISISDSEIYVSKDNPSASYIGAGGTSDKQSNYKIIPSAKIINSIIYDEKGMEITQ